MLRHHLLGLPFVLDREYLHVQLALISVRSSSNAEA